MASLWQQYARHRECVVNELASAFKKMHQSNCPLYVGVLFSGGPAPGGMNVLVGLYEALKKMHGESQLIGFLEGAFGLIEDRAILLGESLYLYRNCGGFDLLGTSRFKLVTEENFSRVRDVIKKRGLHGLVIIGGDDSNTNAYFLHRFLIESQIECHVIGVPKTIDGDLKSDAIEISFGFDTACKVYSELIGNICYDAKSSAKYWHFVQLMGRSASHVALECALQTCPNIAFIAEEEREKKTAFPCFIDKVAEVVLQRARQKKMYGIVLIPESFSELFAQEVAAFSQERDRDPHGNILLSSIEFVKIVSFHVGEKITTKIGNKKFAPVHHFFGYEGRCSAPSLFDAHYTYNLGYQAASLIQQKKSGEMAIMQNLVQEVDRWRPSSISLEKLLKVEERKGEKCRVIAKSLVDTTGPVFSFFASHREKWKNEEHYRSPGPIQFSGPNKDHRTWTLLLERKK